ncbi:hypothetical protein PsorP6_002526 [Peronosclerospora sorghi]|uniref:Uncharacterized protein n=1 Tax=Peronosclerospora sorghi TaxID=230839 RepID=A0ACC0WVV2_9STRA|nr:hypothetical protein PsorP6_002526 [Peronosclerospora sorghi]
MMLTWLIFDNLCEEDQQILFRPIEEHLPLKLRELALDRVRQNVPLTYIRSIACKIVYREGLFFQLYQSVRQHGPAIPQAREESAASCREHPLPNKEDISDLIARGGVGCT